MNTEKPNKVSIAVGDAVLDKINLFNFRNQYDQLLHLLYKNRTGPLVPGDSRMIDLLTDPKKLYIFILLDSTIVSTARCALDDGGPDWNALIGDVITRDGESYRRQGYASQSMNSLEQCAIDCWGWNRSLTSVLTNNPTKGNAGFYEYKGYHKVPTQVWAKQLVA